MSDAEDDTLCATLQQEELEVLESIYPDYIIDSNNDSVRLEIPVELDIPQQVFIVADYADAASSALPRITLAYLPPILLDVTLPKVYPLHKAPVINSVHTRYAWLPDENKVTEILEAAWLKGEGALCNWVELLRSGEFINQLHLVDALGNIRLTHTDARPPLIQTLLTYDASAASAKFSQTSFSCSICFASPKGSRCVRLSCMHVFCRSCLQEYWSFCITEGSVEKVGCADPECVKEAREATEEEVRPVVSEKEVIRWKWLKSKKAIEKDPTVVHCPIRTCQAAVPKPAADPGQSSGWDRFRSCAACGFNFCSFCNHAWHGPISECSKSVVLKIVMEYLDLPEDSSERRTLEQKFGKGVVLRLVRQYQEEKSTDEWLENSTTNCPGCKVHVEKSLGCNHMMCSRCHQHFCYRCGGMLSALDPYAHFSENGNGCYGKLFDVQRETEEWQRVEWMDGL